MRSLMAACGLGVLLIVQYAPADEAVVYVRQIKPLFADKCYACHGALQQQAELRLDTVKSMLEGSSSGPVVVPGHSAKSRLIDHILARKGARLMPPRTDGDPFSPAQVALIRRWIDEGARGPADEKPEADPRDHWAFRPPVRPALPVTKAAKSANPIDAFIAAEWERHGLKPQPAADRRTLLRRVYLDLIGLPPTRAEQDAFLADRSPQAYEKVVDRLLASSRYGERWGRHWMDIWRYSDWWGLGQEVRNSQKHIWHWRDWIIESLNADKGYDQMVREMLAADELYPNDLDRLRATGYLVRPYFIFNRTTWLDEAIEHTAKAFLGLTFNCAKCHDHKYDPVRQKDYYRFRAFFEPYQVRTDQVPGETDYEKDGIPRVFDCNLKTPTYVFFRGDDRQPMKDRPVSAGLPRLLLWEPLKIEKVSLPAEGHTPGLRPFVLENQLRVADQKIRSARAALERARAEIARIEKQKAGAADTEKQLVLMKDNFAAADDHWKLGDGIWEQSQGRLRQTFAGEKRSYVRAKRQPPVDFEARFKFTITGGEPWRSVGINFDVDDHHEALVYATAHAGGPRIQVSYKQAGNYRYPPQASRPWPVQLNKPIELRIRVRGNLVNVHVDRRFVMAYRLPIPRTPGDLQLITYAATAEFQQFELLTLPASVKLIPAGKGMASSVMSLDEARVLQGVAEKTLAVAEIEPALWKARCAADHARLQTPPAADAKDLSRQAASLERKEALLKAEEGLTRAELALLQAEPAKKTELQKKRKAAGDALLQARRSLANPGEKYTPLRGSSKARESNLETEESRTRPYPTISSGRRSALATWLTDRRNPLTARVAVNHMWGRHFGKPLVPTVFDFGRKGTPPTHPALLDFLAVDFMEHGWSMKHLHRLIVTSSAYRLSSSTAGADTKTRTADPENRWYWHTNPIRMDAQVLRDSLLSLAGELDRKMGGPSIPASDESSRRRSIYYVHSHNDNQKFLSMFDNASVRECYRRSESIVPQQALALANSQLAQATAAKINDHLHRQLGKATDAAFIKAAFETILAASPTREEQAECERALSDLVRLSKGRPDAARRARGNLVHALLNHNDFITVR